MVTSYPLCERTVASAVPQAPPPITEARMPDLREPLLLEYHPGRERTRTPCRTLRLTSRPMSKAARAAKVEHVCTGCGYRTSRWVGRCPGCGEWASIVEECGAPGVADAVGIDRVPAESGERLSTGIGELDRVLGGGLVPGAVVLLAG